MTRGPQEICYCLAFVDIYKVVFNLTVLLRRLRCSGTRTRWQQAIVCKSKHGAHTYLDNENDKESNIFIYKNERENVNVMFLL